MLKEFKEFVTRGNVVIVAVGLVMALYFQKIVDAVLDGVINPLIAALLGESNFVDIGFNVSDARVSLGLVIDAIISFFAVAFFLFLVVKAYNRYVVKPVDDVVAPNELDVLVQIRDLLADDRRG